MSEAQIAETWELLFIFCILPIVLPAVFGIIAMFIDHSDKVE